MVGTGDRLHLFVSALVDDGRGAPDQSENREVVTGDRLRYAQLQPLPRRSGQLTWISERPTILTDSDVFDSDPADLAIPSAEAGAAFVSRQRRILRLFFPDRLALTTRSLIP